MTMKRFRFLTSGESHGKCLTAIIEGLPAGFRIKQDVINADLARRQKGYGRGARMQIENDTVEIKSGVRFGKTTGAPVCLEIKNKDFSNWEDVLSSIDYEYPTEEMLRKIEEKSFTKARPGHADYAGSQKYRLSDLRDVLERSSAVLSNPIVLVAYAHLCLVCIEKGCECKKHQMSKTGHKKKM